MDTWILTTLGDMKWKIDDFSRYFVVTAPFGNYIALVPRNENEDRDFAIYDGCGTLLVEDVLSPSYQIVATHWLEDQRLCIFLEDCRCLVYTPNSEPRRMIEVFSEEDIEAGTKVKSALVSGLTCCLITTENDIYFTSDVTSSLAKKAPSLPEDVKCASWNRITCRKSEIKAIGILPDTCISSRNTSVLISVLSGPFKGIIFVVNSTSNNTRMLLVSV